MVPLPFFGLCGRTEGIEKTADPDRPAAHEKPIWYISWRVNRVRRFGAFSWGRPKKLPWDEAIAAELALCLPANAKSRKEGRSLGRRFFITGISVALNGCRGGDTRPLQRLAGCRCRYTSFSATAKVQSWDFPISRSRSKSPTTGRTSKKVQKVGATTDPRHGCSVNTTESAGRLIRFTSSQVALTGWYSVPKSLEWLRNNQVRT